VSGVVFHRTPGFIRELTEVDLERVRRRPEHVDVCAGAEDSRFQAGHDHRHDFRVLETYALDGIGELDIDAEIVRIELQFVAFGERFVFLDIHGQGSHRACNIELPVFILVR